MLNPFTTAAQKVIVYACLAAVVALGALCVILWLRLAGVQSDLDTCAQQRSELRGKVELQSQEVAEWKQNADAAFEAGQEAAKKARALAKVQTDRADALQARILAGAGKSCGEAVGEIRQGWK
jgi:hypothetical protein